MLHRLHLALVLVEQRNRSNQRQILHVVPTRPRLVVQKRELLRVRIRYEKRLQEALGVLVQRHHVPAVVVLQEAFERLRVPLTLVNRPRLLAPLVHGEHDAAVQKLLVHLERRRRQEDHHRALHAVFLRDEPPRRGVFARRCDGELALRLQELQRVRGALGAFLLGDGQDFVREVRFAHVKQRLPRHRRVLHSLLLRHQPQHSLHQRRLPRR